MDKEYVKKLAQNPNFISGIYNYCDRWCERCPLTSRCLNFELGEAQFADSEARDIRNARFWEKLSETFQVVLDMVKEDAEKWGIDLDSFDFGEITQEERLKKETAENHECCHVAKVYGKIVDSWFDSTKGLFEEKENELNLEVQLEISSINPSEQATSIEDAVQIIRWYQHQIFVKLMRAIDGILEEKSDNLDEYLRDSDGSAKVALIAIDRSVSAWGEMRKHFPEAEDKILNMLVHLDQLRRKTEKTFPSARSFIRPGFDQ